MPRSTGGSQGRPLSLVVPLDDFVLLRADCARREMSMNAVLCEALQPYFAELRAAGAATKPASFTSGQGEP